MLIVSTMQEVAAMRLYRIEVCALVILGTIVVLGCGSGAPATQPSSPPSAAAAPEVDVQRGDAAKIPEDFPKDIPLYETMKVQSVTALAGEKAYVVQGTTGDAIEKVAAVLKAKAEASGWRETSPEGAVHEATMSVRNYTKEKRSLNVTLFQQDSDTVINLSTGGA